MHPLWGVNGVQVLNGTRKVFFFHILAIVCLRPYLSSCTGAFVLPSPKGVLVQELPVWRAPEYRQLMVRVLRSSLSFLNLSASLEFRRQALLVCLGQSYFDIKHTWSGAGSLLQTLFLGMSLAAGKLQKKVHKQWFLFSVFKTDLLYYSCWLFWRVLTLKPGRNHYPSRIHLKLKPVVS